MPPGLPKYIDAIPSKGRVYHYFRFRGRRVKMQSAPGSPEWHVEYAGHLAALNRAPGSAPLLAPAAGTLKALIHEYRQAPEFRRLGGGGDTPKAAKARRDYDRMLGFLDPLLPFRPADVKRWHLIKIRNLIAARSGDRTADLFISVCGAVFRHGLDSNYGLELNPAHDIKRLRDEPASYSPWTPAEAAIFEASNPPEFMMTAYMLGRHTSLRLADVLALARPRWDGLGLVTAHSKNAVDAYLPAPTVLRDYLNGLPARGVLFVCDDDGRGLKERHFSKLFRRHLDAIGLSACHFHGLRHTAATALADAGASDREIAAVTGHKSPSMVLRYTKKAAQKKLAKAAVAKLEE